jgi:hypothetical protein
VCACFAPLIRLWLTQPPVCGHRFRGTRSKRWPRLGRRRSAQQGVIDADGQSSSFWHGLHRERWRDGLGGKGVAPGKVSDTLPILPSSLPLFVNWVRMGGLCSKRVNRA